MSRYEKILDKFKLFKSKYFDSWHLVVNNEQLRGFPLNYNEEKNEIPWNISVVKMLTPLQGSETSSAIKYIL